MTTISNLVRMLSSQVADRVSARVGVRVDHYSRR